MGRPPLQRACQLVQAGIQMDTGPFMGQKCGRGGGEEDSACRSQFHDPGTVLQPEPFPTGHHRPDRIIRLDPLRVRPRESLEVQGVLEPVAGADLRKVDEADRAIIALHRIRQVQVAVDPLDRLPRSPECDDRFPPSCRMADLGDPPIMIRESVHRE